MLQQSVATTAKTIKLLGASIQDELGNEFDSVFGDHTTFFVTGSAGRGEMTEGSDIDGYVVRVDGTANRYHDALILVATTKSLKSASLPPLDRSGEFLAMKSAPEVVDRLGSEQDDHTNAFTLRMLFVLESKALMGHAAYEKLFQVVSHAYRGTVKQHQHDFLPFFLVNDIIRYWRTLLLNHEDRLRKKRGELEQKNGNKLTESELEALLLAHRRYRSQKLRFPRCLSCFSTLACFLALAPKDSDSISPEQEFEVFNMTPAERLAFVAELQPKQRTRVHRLLELYAAYLERTSAPKRETLRRLQTDSSFQKSCSTGGADFGEEMFHLIQELGNASRLHRQMLI